jgi:hypothetical protein
LRHLATQNYDGILIVAHSQGSVISADVLRFLQREAELGLAKRDPALGKLVKSENPLPISLFTMGAPIHQLYSFSFPHLYHWGAHYDEPMAKRLSDRPKPQELGVYQWFNTYGSGDYVGRYIWGHSDNMYAPGPHQKFPSKHQSCYEFCLSEGAHTHYWDGTRYQLAQTIQHMIGAIVVKDAAIE